MDVILMNVMIQLLIIAEIFSTIGDVVTGVIGVFADLFSTTGIVQLFWDSTNSELTLISILLLIAVGFAIVMWAFRFVVGLIRFKFKK